MTYYDITYCDVPLRDDTVGNPHRAQTSQFEPFELILLSEFGQTILYQAIWGDSISSTVSSPLLVLPTRTRAAWAIWSSQPHLARMKHIWIWTVNVFMFLIGQTTTILLACARGGIPSNEGSQAPRKVCRQGSYYVWWLAARSKSSICFEGSRDLIWWAVRSTKGQRLHAMIWEAREPGIWCSHDRRSYSLWRWGVT